MSLPMKLLIGYDGSVCAGIAIRDLQRAGLPAIVEAVVLTVTDDLSDSGWRYGQLPAKVDCRISATNAAALATQLMEEAAAVACAGCSLLQSSFPGWRVQGQTLAELPAWGLIWKAAELQPDLMVIGTHQQIEASHPSINRVTATVLSQAPCSVRIGRDHGPDPQRPLRILIGLDASRSAAEAAKVVARRTWPKGSDVRLVMALDPKLSAALAPRRLVGDLHARGIEKEAQTRAAQILDETRDVVSRQNPDLTVSMFLCNGEPKRILLEEAGRWGADSIFLGARGDSHDRDRLLGSVALTVATHALCSVEVVRVPGPIANPHC